MMSDGTRWRALVRGIPDSLPSALAATPPDPPLDVARARAQHLSYVAALAAAGAEVVHVAADEACPDCCFIEDTAIIAGGLAIVTRPGAPSRRAEVEPVAERLAALMPIVRMDAPATLDGGDCLLVGDTLYVGASARSNAEGRAWLRAVLAPRRIAVVDVAVPPRFLHLKGFCSPLGDREVLLAEGTIPPSTFAGTGVITVPAGEAHAANTVVLGGSVLVAAGAPRTLALVEAAGLSAVVVDTSELRRADGSLTCLSIIVG
jgi:dimethylargininase